MTLRKKQGWTNQNVQGLLYSFTSDYNSLWNTVTQICFILFMQTKRKRHQEQQRCRIFVQKKAEFEIGGVNEWTY